MPTVLNARSVGRYRAGAAYVGRPSKFGNPFSIGRDGDRNLVLEKYAVWLVAQHDLLQAARDELRGKDLICWCSPCKCHADILLRIANEY